MKSLIERQSWSTSSRDVSEARRFIPQRSALRAPHFCTRPSYSGMQAPSRIPWWQGLLMHLADYITSLILGNCVMSISPSVESGGKRGKIWAFSVLEKYQELCLGLLIIPMAILWHGHNCLYFLHEEFETQRVDSLGSLLHQITSSRTSTTFVQNLVSTSMAMGATCWGGPWTLPSASLHSTPGQTLPDTTVAFLFPFFKEFLDCSKSGSSGNQATKLNLVRLPTEIGTESSKFPDKCTASRCLSNLKV